MIDALVQSSGEPTASVAGSAHAPEIVVSVRGLTKVFKDFWGRPKARAVDGVDFEVRRGEVFGLLGPNGSGKSTTVKMILGLLYPTKGQIQVFGHSPRHVATKARIGYLPEESYLYRFLDSQETLDFFGSLFELPAKDRQQRTGQLLDMVGLGNARTRAVGEFSKDRQQRTGQLLDMVGLGNARTRAVGEFSKGMQRRIGLAQALINDPDLVILDEPTSGLDPIGCREVKDLIVALARRGKTVILSSHLLADVEDVCDRVVIYYGGKVQAMGTLKELLTEHDSVRITAPPLARETMQKVLDLIRADVAADRVRVDNPTQNLESYFLDVVKKARAQAAETSGATSENRIAEYLRGGDVPAGDKALERFTRQPETPKAAPTTEPAAPAPAATAKLAALAKPAEPVTPAAQPASPSPAPENQVDLKKANDKLSGLLGKKS